MPLVRVKTWLLAALAVLALATLAATPSHAATGAWWRLQSDPAVVPPNDGRDGKPGPSFAATKVGQPDNPEPIDRWALELASGRNHWTVLYAPLLLDARVTLTDDLRFGDTIFPTRDVIDHRYQFDGYRVTYLRSLLDRGVTVDVGGALQVRNESVQVASRTQARRDVQDDIGVVPALAARLRWDASQRSWLGMDATGLSTFGLFGDTRGPIYDVGAEAGMSVGRGVDLTGTLRLVGGGAAAPEPAFEHRANSVVASVGLRVSFDRATR